mgnify:CR=1 FL=1
MSPETLPVIGPIINTGPNDRLFDGLLFLGPILLLLIAVLGRRPFTVVFAFAYVIAFLAHIVHNNLRMDAAPNDESRRPG